MELPGDLRSSRVADRPRVNVHTSNDVGVASAITLSEAASRSNVPIVRPVAMRRGVAFAASYLSLQPGLQN